MRLAELVRITPGFKAAVNLETDWDDEAKVQAYIPTAFARNVLREIAASLGPESKSRAHLLHGAYGTGKSHLALVLGHYLSDGWGRDWLRPLFDRIETKSADLAIFLREQRVALGAPLLFVHVHGSEAPTREALLGALDKALNAVGLAHLMPATAFQAAVGRVESYLQMYPDAAKDMEQAFQSVGYGDINAMLSDLGAYRDAALKAFLVAHPRFSRGAPFDRHLAQKPEEVYRAVARELQSLPRPEKRSGILVIWDEFGLQLESVLQDSKDRSYLDLQNFAEACSGSGPDNLHFIGLAHRSIEQTVATLDGMTAKDKELLNRIAGRFEQRRVTAQPGEQFRLLSNVILPADKVRIEAFWSSYTQWAAANATESLSRNLFKELSAEEVKEVVIRGSYPLHPAATFVLPTLSEKVAQNDRTLFHFLSDPGPNGLPSLLQATDAERDGSPVQITLDRLFPFFSELLANTRRDGIREVWNRFRRLPPQSDELGVRVLQSIVILLVASLPEIRPNIEGLSFALGMTSAEQRDELWSKLEEMRSGKLLRRWPNHEYDLRGLDGDVDLEEALQAALTDVPRVVDSTELVGAWAKQAGIPGGLPATRYNDAYAHNRFYDVLWTTSDGLDKSRFKDSGAPNGVDGIALFVAALNSESLERSRAQAMAFKNPRAIVVLPHVPLVIEPLIRKYLALQLVERRLAPAFGMNGSQRDEFDKELKATVEEICSRIRRAFEPCLAFLAGAQHSYDSWAALTEAASQGMEQAFPKTMRISHDKLLEMASSDSYRAHRVTAINSLFQLPLNQIASVPLKPVQFIIDAVLCQTGWLRQAGDKWILGRPDSATYPNSAATWDLIEGYITRPSKAPTSFLKLYDDLTSPPFGLRPRTLPLLLAAVMHEHQSSITLVQGGQVVQPSGEVIEKLVKEPQKTTTFYARISNEQRWILELMLEVFRAVTPLSEEGPLGQVKRLVTRWSKKRIPPLALRTRKLSDKTLAVRDQVLIPLVADATERDVRRVLFETLPRIAGVTDLNTANYSTIHTSVGELLRSATTEMENVLIVQVIPVLAKAFGSETVDEAALKAALSQFVQAISPLNRDSLSTTELAFVQATGPMLPEPMQHLETLARAVGAAAPAEWTDEDVPYFGGRVGVLREALIAKATVATIPDVPSQPSTVSHGQQDPGQAPPADATPPASGSVPTVSPNPKPEVTRPAGGVAGRPAFVPPRPAQTTELVLTLGEQQRRFAVGSVLPVAARNTLATVLTAVRRPDLTKEDQAKILAEALAQILGPRN